MTTVTNGKATELITFTRGTLATVTDADGKIKWAPHNLVTYSEQFDNADWTINFLTVGSNAAVAPNGTTTAEQLTATSTVTTHRAFNTSSNVTVPSVTFGCFVKANGYTKVGLRESATSGAGATFNLSGSGSVIGTFDSGGSTTSNVTISALANGWFYISCMVSFASPTHMGFGLHVLSPSYVSGDINAAWAGDNVSGIYAWGAHLYRSDLGGMQANASAYPMYNPTTPKNLLGYSESLDTGWTGTSGGLQGTGFELVTNGAFDSDVSNWLTFNCTIAWVAGKLELTSTGAGFCAAYQSLTTGIKAGRGYIVSGSTQRLGASSTAQIRLYDVGPATTPIGGLPASSGALVSGYSVVTPVNNRMSVSLCYLSASGAGDKATFDAISVQEVAFYGAPNNLQTARAVEATSANATLLSSVSLLASPYTFSIWLKRKAGSGNVQLTVDGSTYTTVSVTDTWTRFSTTLTPSAGTKTPGIRLVTSGDAVYAWGAQLSDSASLDTYSPVYGAAVTSAAYHGPRLDYSSSGSALGLLVEEARTNVCLSSSDLNGSGWQKLSSGTASAPVVTSNYGSVISPDGSASASRVQFDRGAGTTSSDVSRMFQEIADPASGVGVVSVWLRSTDGTSSYSLEIVNGNAVSQISVTGTWVRHVLVSTNTTVNLQIRLIGSYGASSTADIVVWGAQLEYGSFATSYIPTGAATVTRNADVASVSTQAFPYSSTEGTLVASGVFSTAGRYVGLYNTSSNQIEIYQNNSTSVIGFVYASSATQASISATANAFSVNKIALAFKENDVALSANGGTVVTDNTAVIPVTTSLTLNAYVTSVLGSGWIRQITYLPRRISNTELQTRTA